MMQFSCAYNKRKHYVRQLQVPPFSEAKRQLGNELAQVLLDECPASLQTHMRLTHPLQGPGARLWTSPSDLLIGKVVLKPPLTARYVKALTHEGILNIGEEFEAQWLLAVEQEQRLAMANLEQLLGLLAERDKERAVRDALRDCEAAFRRHLAAVNGEFEALLVAELAALERSMREYYERLIEEQVNACNQMQEDYVDEQIEDAVNATVDNLTRKFLADLEAQEVELEAMYRARLDGQHERHLEALRHQEAVFGALLRQLKHSLQCNNISSLMYVLCLERRRCMREKQRLVNATSQRARALEAANDAKAGQIARLRCELRETQRKLAAREQCLLGVIGQFQKFVNYALKAAPTQAEFLLSVEKMMTLELTRALAARKSRRFLMPWRRASASDEAIPTANDDDGGVSYHDCLNEADPPVCPDDADDQLLLLDYNNRLYVREDFRNRLTHAELGAAPALWSRDVAAYVELMQAVNLDDDVVDSRRASYPPAYSVGSKMTHGQSSVTFMPPTENATDTVGLLAVQDSVQMQHPEEPAVVVTAAAGVCARVPIQPSQPVNVALLATTDSVTLLKEKHGASLVLAQPVDDEERELQVIPAPSTATIHIVKRGPRRVTSCSHSTTTVVSGTCSVASMRLQIRKSGGTAVVPAAAAAADDDVKSKKSALASKTSQPPARRVRSGDVVTRKSPLPRSGGSHRSTLRDHRDSLELVTAAHNVGTTQQRIRNIILPAPAADPEYPTTRLVINAPAERRDLPSVDFKQVADVFGELSPPERPWQIYERAARDAPSKARVENFLEQTPTAKVLGKPDAVEAHATTRKDFAAHRVRSILDVLKKDESLIRLFTKCTQ